MKIAILFHDHPSQDLDLFFQLQGLKNVLVNHSLYIGPIPSWDDPRAFRLALSHYQLVLFSGLDSNERKLFLEHAGPLGLPCMPFGSVPTAFCSFEKTNGVEGRAIFIPDEFEDKDRNVRQQRLFSILNKRTPTLWMAQTSKAFELGPWMGIGNLYTPKAPHLHLAALGAASHVITCRLAPAVMAASRKIPTVLVSFSEEMTKVAQVFGIPTLAMGKKRSAAKLLAEVSDFLTQYPWTEVSQNITAEVLHFKKDLERAGVTVPSFSEIERGVQKNILPRSEFSLPLVSMVDNANLPTVEGWIANLENKADMKLEFHLLSLEDGVSEKLAERFKTSTFYFYKLSELWTQEELPHLLSKGTGLLGLLSKPKLLQMVLRKVKGEVFYCDPECFFYGAPSHLLTSFASGQILLFPTWKDELREARRTGLFESGLLGLRPGAEDFLSWWDEQGKLLAHRSFELAESLSRVMLDFVPLYFRNAHIYRGGEHSVAPWNIETLGASLNELVEFGPSLSHERKVMTYLARKEDSLGIFEAKVGWDQLIAFLGPRFSGTPAFLEKVWKVQERYSPRLRKALRLGRKSFRSKFLYTTKLWLSFNRVERLLFRLRDSVGFIPQEITKNPWEGRADSTPTPWVASQRKAFQMAIEGEEKTSTSSLLKKAS